MAEPPHPNDHGLLNWEVRIFGAPNPFPSDDPRHVSWRSMAAWVTEADARLKAEVLRRRTQDFSSLTLEYHVGRFDIIAMALIALCGHDYEGVASFKEKLAEVAESLLGFVQSVSVPAYVQKQSLVADIRSRLSQRSAHWLAEALKTVREGERQVPQSLVSSAPPPSPSAPGERPASASVFRQDANGDWELAFGTKRCVGVKHVEGMMLIRTLLAAPGQEFSAFALVVAGAMPADPRRTVSCGLDEDGVTEDGLVILKQDGQGGGVPALDHRARSEATAELAELIKQRSEAEANNNTEDYERADAKIEQLTQYLRAGVGRFGIRVLGSDRERARKTAIARYRTALKVVQQSLPELAEHLKQSIRSGAPFRYCPDKPIDWQT